VQSEDARSPEQARQGAGAESGGETRTRAHRPGTHRGNYY
jgi:hypothetical protein